MLGSSTVTALRNIQSCRSVFFGYGGIGIWKLAIRYFLTFDF